MDIAVAALFLALWVQGALTLVLLFVLGRRRLPRIAAGEIRIADIAVSGENWPEDARLASNAFDNQFQLPVLFYLGTGLALYLGAGLPEAILAWVFVASRVVHATIHVTTNRVQARFAAYMVGYGVLLALWGLILARLVAELV